jgi:hypothetical protein
MKMVKIEYIWFPEGDRPQYPECPGATIETVNWTYPNVPVVTCSLNGRFCEGRQKGADGNCPFDKGNPDTCDHQLHNLVLLDASYENKMDTSYTRDWATLKCLACGKLIHFYTYSGLTGSKFYRDDVVIQR